MADRDITAWIESKPGPFESASMIGVWCAAHADFYGRDMDAFDLGFMLTVNEFGFYERRTPSGYILEMTP